MSQPTFGNGKICYIEIPSLDVNKSAEFYQKIFGWIVRTSNEGMTSFDDGVGEVSGTWRTDRKPVTELGTLIHIMVDDIEKSIQAIIENGGQLVQPVGMEAPEITARFSDPSGNVFGLYQHGG